MTTAMTSHKYNVVAVGAFTLLALASFIVALTLLAGRSGPTDNFYTVYVNVAGLKQGSQVLLQGFPIGEVEQITPFKEGAQTKFRVDMSLGREWPIPEDSVANSLAPGVLAAQVVSITAGASPNPLKPGALITPDEAAGLPLAENVNRQLSLLGEIVERDVRPMMANANKILAETAQRWPVVLTNAETASGNLVGLTERVEGVLSEDKMAEVDRLIERLAASGASLEEMTRTGGRDLTAGLAEFRATMEGIARHSESFAQNLDTTSLNLQEFSRQLRQNPGSVIRNTAGQPDPVPAQRDGRSR